MENLVITLEPIEGQKLPGNLLPTEINRVADQFATQLNKAAGRDWIGKVTYEFQGKTHNVPIKVPA